MGGLGNFSIDPAMLQRRVIVIWLGFCVLLGKSRFTAVEAKDRALHGGSEDCKSATLTIFKGTHME